MEMEPELKRIGTGVSGLDDVLRGGLPQGQMYLLEGDPGTGKTTVAMQFVIEGVRSGQTALYITLSESTLELRASARSHGWDAAELPIAEFVPDEASLSPEQQYTVFHPSEVELAGTIRRMTELIDERRPDRVVIDSLSELRLLAADTMRYRRQLLALKQYFMGREITVLLLDDRAATSDGSDRQLRSIAHGVIRLEKAARSFGTTRRQIEVLKLRGSAYREGFHDYTIERGGVRVYPRLIAGEHETEFGSERLLSGVGALDMMFGGGVSRGSSTLVLGPSGAGKSTIAMQFAHAAAQRGDRAVVYMFDEVLRTAQDRAEALRMPVRAEIEKGTLAMMQIDPAELSPGEFVWRIRRDLLEHDTRVVVIDSVSGFMKSMPGELDLMLHLHELLSFLNQSGVVTFFIMNQHGVLGPMESEADVSYLADTVVLLRYFEVKGEMRQLISVLKQRVGAHEHTLRELRFSGERGVEVGKPLREFRGVLTGVPDFDGTGV